MLKFENPNYLICYSNMSGDKYILIKHWEKLAFNNNIYSYQQKERISERKKESTDIFVRSGTVHELILCSRFNLVSLVISDRSTDRLWQWFSLLIPS